MVLGVVILAESVTILFAQTNDSPIPEKTKRLGNASKVDPQQEGSVLSSTSGNVDPTTKVELQQLFSELSEKYLDTRAASLDRWMWLITALLALFGLVIPIALAVTSYVVVRHRVREFEAEAEKSVEEARKLVEEIKGHRSQSEAHLRDILSEDNDDPEKAQEVEEAFQEFQSDPQPDFIDKVIAQIHTLQRDGKISEAIEKWHFLANISEGNDNKLAAHAWLSIRYLLTEEEERLAAYNKAMDLDPNYTRSYMNRREAKYSNQSRHGIVVGAVQHYFDDPKFGKFSTALEHRIGSGSYRADVVIYDEGGQLTVAVECMRIGYIDERTKDQLKEYFRHSDAQFGILAADTDSSKWTFLRMLENEIDEVNRSQFEEELMGSGSS